MLVAKEHILSLIPQRQPFVMIDRLMYSDEKTTGSEFIVPEENIFTINGSFTESGLVENIAQTAAARAGYLAQLHGKPVAIGYIGAIKNLGIYALPKVNDKLETEIVIENHIFDVTLISGKIKCNEVLLAQCEMKIFIIQTQNLSL